MPLVLGKPQTDKFREIKKTKQNVRARQIKDKSKAVKLTGEGSQVPLYAHSDASLY